MTVPNNYISGTPFDTAAWGVTGGASYNVQSNAASDYYPRHANQFTFSGTGSFAYYLVPNPYPKYKPDTVSLCLPANGDQYFH